MIRRVGALTVALTIAATALSGCGGGKPASTLPRYVQKALTFLGRQSAVTYIGAYDRSVDPYNSSGTFTVTKSGNVTGSWGGVDFVRVHGDWYYRLREGYLTIAKNELAQTPHPNSLGNLLSTLVLNHWVRDNRHLFSLFTFPYALHGFPLLSEINNAGVLPHGQSKVDGTFPHATGFIPKFSRTSSNPIAQVDVSTQGPTRFLDYLTSDGFTGSAVITLQYPSVVRVIAPTTSFELNQLLSNSEMSQVVQILEYIHHGGTIPAGA